jgi:hypothetical protein
MRGSIILKRSMDDAIIFTNNHGSHVYRISDLLAGLLPIDKNLYYDNEGWFTNFFITSKSTVIYEIVSHAEDDTIFSVWGELQSDGKYHTFYASVWHDNYLPVGMLDANTLILRDKRRADRLSLWLLDTTSGAMKSFFPSFSPLYSEVFWQFSEQEGNIKRDGVSYLLNAIPWDEHRFSPDKTRVFLFLSDSNGMKYILWDNEHQKILWNKTAYAPSPIAPQWTMSSEKIAYVEGEDLYILTRNGEERKLLLPPGTYLNVLLPFKWSPSGNYLAFWIGSAAKREGEMQSFELVIYDVKHNTITNTCIPLSEGSGTGDLFWSPDERQVVISRPQLQYLWYDIQGTQAWQFSMEGEILGWVK